MKINDYCWMIEYTLGKEEPFVSWDQIKDVNIGRHPNFLLFRGTDRIRFDRNLFKITAKEKPTVCYNYRGKNLRLNARSVAKKRFREYFSGRGLS